ncbi:MAG: ABC transporter substrate-binding protein [Candidatus Eiseniibacteriota bacterium]|jgi:peptide/nickel transport system substrate-binding protein
MILDDRCRTRRVGSTTALLVLVAGIALGGCRPADRPQGSPEAPGEGPASGDRRPAGTPATSGTRGPRVGGTFRYAETSDIPALDPVRVDDTASNHVATQIFDGLVSLDDDLEIVPALATDWRVSDDGLTWTFELRRDVFFHDDPCFVGGRGRALVAADVKASFERICDPGSGSTGHWIFAGKIRGADAFHRGETAGVEGFEVVDPHTFRLHLERPYAPILRLLTMPYTLVVAPEAVARYGATLDHHPVGTGPFQLAEWEPGRRLRLERHERYWDRDREGRRLPYLEAVDVRFVDDPVEQVRAFERGELDMLYPIPPAFFQTLVVPEGGVRTGIGNYVIQSSPELDVQYIGFRMDLEPFAGNRALRQAFNYAVDRVALVERVVRRGRPAHHGVLPPGLPGFNRELTGYHFDLERARSLMAAAGYPDGEGFPELTLQVNAGGTATVELAEAVAAQLGRLGVRIRVRALDWAEHLRTIEDEEVPFFRMAWLADYPDPENFLALFLSRNLAPHGPNATRYVNPEFDRLIDQALATTDDDDRTALYQRAESLVVEDAPWLFLFHAESYRLIQSWVRGFPINSLDHRVLKRVWLERG